MRKIKWEISTGYYGADYRGEFEVEDNTTDKEIEEMIEQEVWNYICYSWEEVRKDSEQQAGVIDTERRAMMTVFDKLMKMPTRMFLQVMEMEVNTDNVSEFINQAFRSFCIVGDNDCPKSCNCDECVKEWLESEVEE